MKLIDLLVKELPKCGGWPKDAVTAIYFSHKKGATFYDKDGMCLKNGVSFICMDMPGVRREEVTKEEFGSALAASEGWIEWGGGGCPVDTSEIIDIKFRDGGIDTDKALGWRWHHDNNCADIIAYRLHKPDLNSRANDDRLEQDLNECIGQDVDIPEWDGVGLPPVGVGCEWQDKNTKQWQPVKVVYSSEWVTVVREINKEKGDDLVEVAIENYGDESRRKFRPLRAQAEKSREKLAAALHIAAASPIELSGIGPLYFELADAIISGSVFGTTFKADE